MRVYEIIEKLTRAELRDFGIVMENSRRKATRELFRHLRLAARRGEEPGKEKLHAALFGAPWEKAKDYLLRNELRLLSDALTDFLVVRKFEAEMKKSPRVKDRWLMEVYREKGLNKHLETRFRKGYAAAQEAQQYKEAVALVQQYQEYVMGGKEVRSALIRGLIELEQEQLRLLRYALVEQVREVEAKMAGACRILRISEPDVEVPETMESLEMTGENWHSPMANFLREFALAYQYRGRERVAILEKASGYLKDVVGERRVEKEMVAFASIALEYFLLGEYLEADEWYGRLFEIARKPGDDTRNIRLEIVFNYVSNLIKLRKFDRAVHIFHQFENAARKNSRVWFRFLCLAGMSYVFLEDPKGAAACVPPDIHHRPEPQYNYFRFILLLIFYLRGDLEDTLRETRNFEQALAHRSEHEVDVRKMVRLFREFVVLGMETPEIRQKRLPGLRERIRTYAETLPPMLSDFLPFVWLRRKVQA